MGILLMTDRQRRMKDFMKSRLRNYYLRKSLGLPLIHWTRCGWKRAA